MSIDKINDEDFESRKEQVRTLRTAIYKLNEELINSYNMGLELHIDADFFATTVGYRSKKLQSLVLNEAYYEYNKDFLLEIIKEENDFVCDRCEDIDVEMCSRPGHIEHCNNCCYLSK